MRSAPQRPRLRRAGRCALAGRGPRGFFEHADEQLADDLALALGVDHVVERAEEAVAGLHVHEIDRELAAERVFHLLGLVAAQQTGVDEHTRELVADRLVHERGRDRRVDTTRQPADHALGSDLRADLVDARSMIDTLVHVGRQPAASKRNALRISLPVLGVRDLGVELDRVDAAVAVFDDRGRRGLRAAGHDEARRRLRHRVEVAHPDDLLGGLVGEQYRRALDRQCRAAVLARAGLGDLAAEIARDELRAVTDAQDRHTRVVERGSIDGAPST